MSEIPNLPNFEKEKEIKPIRKATTLYLNSENYKFVKENLKGKSISQFIDETLEMVANIMKEQQKKKNSEEKKEIGDGKKEE